MNCFAKASFKIKFCVARSQLLTSGPTIRFRFRRVRARAWLRTQTRACDEVATLQSYLGWSSMTNQARASTCEALGMQHVRHEDCRCLSADPFFAVDQHEGIQIRRTNHISPKTLSRLARMWDMEPSSQHQSPSCRYLQHQSRGNSHGREWPGGCITKYEGQQHGVLYECMGDIVRGLRLRLLNGSVRLGTTSAVKFTIEESRNMRSNRRRQDPRGV